MTELTELEEMMRSLKKDNHEKKRLVAELESEKKYLEERNRYLIEKLKQAGVLYEESGKRLMDFVNENVKPLKTRLAEFESMSQKTREYEKSITSALKKIDDFGGVVGNFRNEMIKNSEKQAEITARLAEIRKSHAEISKRISTVQTFGSEDLAEKVEEIKAKSGEDVRKIEDEFGVLKLGVASSIDNFKKEFERQANALRNEMEKVDIKKAKELGDALARTTEELNKAKAEFARLMVAAEKQIENLDVKKTKEISKSVEMLAANLEERFSGLSADLDKRILSAESDLNRFRIELEKTLGKAKTDTRDFVAAKSKEFDSLLAELKEKVNVQVQASVAEWNKNLGSLRSDLINTKKEVEQLIGMIDRKVEAGEERREKKADAALAQISASLDKKLEGETGQIYGQIDEVSQNIERMKDDMGKKVMDSEKELAKFKVDLEKALGKAKIDTRDFVAAKSKEFDSLLAQMKGRIDRQVQDSAAAWDNSLGSLRTDLIASKKNVEKLIGIINRKVETGEERREKKIDAGFLSMQSLLTKKIESETDNLNAQIDDVARSVEDAKSELSKTVGLLGKSFDASEVRRKKDIDKIIKEFMVVKGAVDEKINEVSGEIEKFSRMSETLRRQIVKESLAGVQERTKVMFDGMEKKFEIVEDGLIDKISSMESDMDEFRAGFQGTMASLKAESDRKAELLAKEFEKRDAARDREAGIFAKSVQKDVDTRFSALAAKIDGRMKSADDGIGSLTKTVDNFTVDLSEKFDSIIQAKTKEFEKAVKSLVADMKSMERDVNLVINSFKSDIEKREMQKKGEVDRMLREFIAAKGKIDEKMLQVDKKISEFSEIRKELKKEIYKESLAGVQERVKDIVAGIEERFDASRDETGNKISEVMKSADARIREAESDINSFRVELGKTIGNLRTDVDKITGKKTTEMDKIVDGLKKDFEERVGIVNAELLKNFDEMKDEMAGLRADLAKNVTFIRKEFEVGESRRIGKAEKAMQGLEKEFRLKVDEFAASVNARMKSSETEIKTLTLQMNSVMADLKDKFEDIISDKTDAFEASMDAVVEKTEKARKDAEAVAENLKAKFAAGEEARRRETEKSLKELMVVKGEMARRMKEIDDGIAKFSGTRDALKSEIEKDNSAMIENRLASFSDYKKTEIADVKKSLKTDMGDMRIFLDKAVEKLGRLSDKIDAVKEEIYTVKKARSLLVDDVRSLGKTVEANTDAKIRTFMKDMEKSLRSHEDILNARMAAMEKKMGAVSDHASRTKKEKEEQLDELLRHVES